MSHEARHRDIAALLARGVVRVKKQPLVAKEIESHMPNGKAYPAIQPSQGKSMRVKEENQEQADSATPMQHGSDQ